jgi:hypothetical protein
MKKIPPIFCFVDEILGYLDQKLKAAAEVKPVNSTAAVAAYQKLLMARRKRLAHQARCVRCNRRPLSLQELRELGETVGELFEEEAMRLARLDVADEESEAA